MNVSIIVAAASNGVIGFKNELLWHLPDDFKRFKEITSGHPIIMGRKTFESLGRPLPRRLNIVITRNPDDYHPEGVEVADSLEFAVRLAGSATGYEEIFIIGGGEIYRQSFPIVTKIYLTQVHAQPEGDTFFVIPDPDNWKVVSSVSHDADERHQYAFDYIDLVKVK